MKRLLVIAMERACEAVDCVRPYWLVRYSPLRWLGCPSGLALWSSQLDERWSTGVWQGPAQGDAE